MLAPKLSLRYVTSIGQSGNPPYRTADGCGSWGGVWGYVMDICTVDDHPTRTSSCSGHSRKAKAAWCG